MKMVWRNSATSSFHPLLAWAGETGIAMWREQRFGKIFAQSKTREFLAIAKDDSVLVTLIENPAALRCAPPFKLSDSWDSQEGSIATQVSTANLPSNHS